MESIIIVIMAFIALSIVIIVLRRESKLQDKQRLEKVENDKAVAKYQAHLNATRKREKEKKINSIKYLEDTALDKHRVLEFEIAGLYYLPSHAHDEAGYLDVGSMLDLKLNPSNEYDSYAVKIMSGNVHIGFIPELYSENIFKAIRRKEQFIVVVTSTDKGYIPHIRVKVFPRENRRLLDYL